MSGPRRTNRALLNTTWISSGLMMPIVEVTTISPTTAATWARVGPEQWHYPAGGVPIHMGGRGRIRQDDHLAKRCSERNRHARRIRRPNSGC
jgi:hypothetical protein